MKKIALLFGILIVAMTVSASGRGKFSLLKRDSGGAASSATTSVGSAGAVFEEVRRQYSSGKISADSVVKTALYHKTGNPRLAEQCLRLVADSSPKGLLELGVLYAFTPEFSSKAAEGVKLLQQAAKAGENDADCYLGLYYYNHGDFKKAKAAFDACDPINYGFGYTALGGMYLEGKGVRKDIPKARECYRQAALKGYPRGMSLYGFNMRAKGGGDISYPDSFFWLYIAGDLGEDAARTTLCLPRLNQDFGSGEAAQDATTALQFIEMVNSVKGLKNDPLYKDGFLVGLKDREKAAEQGDDWSRYYLGSMNYNGDFLNQNYAQAIRYYEPVARDARLPRTVLAVVNERLAGMYRDGKGTKADAAKAARYLQAAARYGSPTAYKAVEGTSR